MVLVFFMVRMVPGDPVSMIVGDHANPEVMSEMRHALGLDVSPGQQFALFLRNLLRAAMWEIRLFIIFPQGN